MRYGHGHVTPNPDGYKARCGGPGLCLACNHELKQKTEALNTGIPLGSVSASVKVNVEPEATKHPFIYHRPSPEQVMEIETVRNGCKALHDILLALPPCRERYIATEKLEEVSMWANKCIVLHEG